METDRRGGIVETECEKTTRKEIERKKGNEVGLEE